MKISIIIDDDSRVVLTLAETQLENHQKLQILTWFKKDGNSLVSENVINLEKVIQYFDKEGIEYELSNKAQNYIDQHAKQIKNQAIIFSSALDFKQGKFDRRDLNEFSDSLGHMVKRKLKDHQVKSTYHLNLVGNGANFSVPGSGKTTVVLTYFQKLRLEKKVNTLFVVGPPACFYPWQDEYKEVLGETPKVKILSGLNKDGRQSVYADTYKPNDLYLITFQTLLNDTHYIKEFLSSPHVNALLVIDEAHYMKRINGNWASAVLNIAKSAPYRCALTGTPIPRSYNDLLNLMEFLWPNDSPITSQDKARLEIYEENGDFESAAKLLEPKIGPLFYRVRKSDLGLKPQIFHEPTKIKMNKYERKLYEAIVNKIRDYGKDDYLKNIDLVTQLRRGRMIRTRQSLSYTRLLASALKGYSEDMFSDESQLKDILLNYDDLEVPAKIEALLSKVRNLNKSNQKVVIWSNFIGTIDLIMKHLKKEGLYSKKITGSVPVEREKFSSEETRERIRDEFVDPGSGLDILIANPAACAESISLHKTCHHAMYYDLSYNLAQYLQSLDRIHRVGASEKISAYYDFLTYENTIDEDIINNLALKAEKMAKIIDQDYRIYSLDMSDVSGDEEAYERLFTKPN